MGEVKLKGGSNVPNAGMQSKKHYWWRYLLVWIGASIFTLGAVAAGVYVSGGIIPVKTYINIFADPDEYLTPEYQDKSLFNIIKIIMSGEIDTLEDVNRITPLVYTYFEQINTDYVEPNLKFKFDWDEAKYVPLVKKSSYGEKDYPLDDSTTLPQYLVDELKKNTLLANLINIETSPYKTLLTYFLYDVERDDEGNVVLDEFGKPVIGEPYSVYDFMNQENKNYLGAYDSTSEAYNPQEEDFFKHVMDNVLDCGRVCDLDASFNPQDPLMEVIQNYTLREILGGKLNDLTIGEIFKHQGDKGLLSKLFRMTLGELNTFDFDNARFSDLMDITYAYDSEGNRIKGSIKEYDVVYDEHGNVIDKDTVSPLVLRSMGEFKANSIQDENVLDNYYIGQFVEVTSTSDSALKTLAGFTFKEIKEPNFMDKLQLQEIINIPEKGEEGYSPLLDALRENTLGSLKKDETFKKLHLSSFYSLEELEKDKANNRVLIALLKIDTEENPVTLGNIASKVNEIEIGEFMDIGTNPSRLLLTVSKKKLPELSGLINGLMVEDVMDVEVGSSYHDTSLDKYYYYNHKGEWKEYVDDSEHTAKELFDLDYEDLSKKQGYYEGVSDEFVAKRIREGADPVISIDPTEYGVVRSELYDIREVKLSDPGDFINQIKHKMKLNALVEINTSSPKVLQNLKDCTLDEVADTLKDFTLEQMIDVPAENKLLNAVKDAKLFVGSEDPNYIGNRINNLTLGQMIDMTSAPTILQTLSSYTINGDDPTKRLTSLDLTTLYFNQIVTEEEFTNNDSTGILKELWGSGENAGKFKISEIPSRLMNCSLITVIGKQVYEDETAESYDDSSVLKKQWWYLLTSSTDYASHNYTDDTQPDYEAPFIYGHLDSGKTLKLNEINQLIENLQYHFANRTIRELVEAGFLTIDSVTLNKIIGGQPLGEYTINGLLAVIS